MGRPLLLHDLLGSRQSRSVPSCFVLTMFHTHTSKLRYKATARRKTSFNCCEAPRGLNGVTEGNGEHAPIARHSLDTSVRRTL